MNCIYLLMMVAGPFIYCEVIELTSELVVAVMKQNMNDRLYTKRRRRPSEPET